MDTAAFLKELKLLYVEDEPETRDELTRYLKRRFGTVITASNGMEGLEKFKLHDPDMIITDLRMPEMTGLEMLETIKIERPLCPVIVVSALSDSESILEAVEKGIARYVVKPVDPASLQATLDIVGQELFLRQMKANIRTNDLSKRLADREQKLIFESRLKSEYAAFLKQLTGKGPREIAIHLVSGTMTLTASEVLTPMEQSLIMNNRNFGLVSYNRHLFYEEHLKGLIGSFEKTLSCEVALSGVHVSVEKNYDQLKFSLL